jgi:response regulator RpfG family c-di-GMP phosphodiesterase
VTQQTQQQGASQGPVKKRILVVDDNDDFRTVLSMSLQSKGYAISQAASGKEAALTLAAQSFDAILSDIEMPDLNGIQLLALLSTIKCPSPVLLMTGHEPTGYLEDAKKHGVAGFLLKPFSTQFLIERLEKVLSGFRPDVNAPPAAPQQRPASSFTASANTAASNPMLQAAPLAQVEPASLQMVGLEDLFVGKTLEFDLYILDSEGRPRRIGENRKEMDPHLRSAAKTGRFGDIYAVRSEYETVVMKNLGLLGSGRPNTDPPAEPAKQTEVLGTVQEKGIARLRCESVDPKLFRLCWSLSEVCLGIAVRQPGLALFVDDLLKESHDSLSRAVGTSVYSLLICHRLGWRSPATLYKIAFGAILHDIGLILVPESVRLKPDSQREIPERDDYERHPLHGVKLLRDVGLVAEEFTQIVGQHHENRLGTGYPARLREQAIFPLARVVALSNQFVDSILGGPGNAPMKVTDAWALMTGGLRGSFTPQVLQALGEVIGAPPETLVVRSSVSK